MRSMRLVHHVSALLSQIFLTTFLTLFAWSILLTLVLGWTPTVVMSGSMMPTIRTGDILLADPMDTDELMERVEPGHVLLAENPALPETLVTHRVTEVDAEKKQFITKGDANQNEDSTPVPVENVLGIERILIPYIGMPVQGIRTGNYIPLALFSGGLVISYLLIRKEFALIKGEDEQDENQEIKSPTLTEFAEPRSKKRLVLGIVIATSVVVSLVSSFLLGGSSAAFLGRSLNAGSTFKAASTFAITENCWTKTVSRQVFVVPMKGNGVANYAGNLTITFDSDPTKGYTYKFEVPASVVVTDSYVLKVSTINSVPETVNYTGTFKSKVSTAHITANMNTSKSTINLSVNTGGTFGFPTATGSLDLYKCT